LLASSPTKRREETARSRLDLAAYGPSIALHRQVTERAAGSEAGRKDDQTDIEVADLCGEHRRLSPNETNHEHGKRRAPSAIS